MAIGCDTCRYEDTPTEDAPCATCVGTLSNRTPKGEVEMLERSCATCGFEPVPKTTVVCKVCLEPGRVSLPNYKAKAGIPAIEQKQEVTFDEDRIDIIGPNGNEGLHYDAVQKPKHYQLLPGVEVIDIRRALLAKVDGMDNPPSAFAVNCWDRALEYTIRAWEKNGVGDLEKAVTYLQWCIGELKK